MIKTIVVKNVAPYGDVIVGKRGRQTFVGPLWGLVPNGEKRNLKVYRRRFSGSTPVTLVKDVYNNKFIVADGELLGQEFCTRGVSDYLGSGIHKLNKIKVYYKIEKA